MRHSSRMNKIVIRSWCLHYPPHVGPRLVLWGLLPGPVMVRATSNPKRHILELQRLLLQNMITILRLVVKLQHTAVLIFILHSYKVTILVITSTAECFSSKSCTAPPEDQSLLDWTGYELVIASLVKSHQWPMGHYTSEIINPFINPSKDNTFKSVSLIKSGNRSEYFNKKKSADLSRLLF